MNAYSYAELSMTQKTAYNLGVVRNPLVGVSDRSVAMWRLDILKAQAYAEVVKSGMALDACEAGSLKAQQLALLTEQAQDVISSILSVTRKDQLAA